MADLKKKALEAVASAQPEAEVASQPMAAAPAADTPAPAAKKDEDMSWGDLLTQSLVALAPVGIGAALGGGEGAQAGARAGQSALEGIKSAAANKRSVAKEEEELGFKRSHAKNEERKIKGDEEESKKKLALEYAKLEQSKADHLAKSDQGKVLTAEQTGSLADLDASEMQINSLKAAIDKHGESMGPFAGRMSQMNPYGTSAKAFDSQMKIAAQNIGKALEGGKLTDADIARYREMLPSMQDTPDVAKAKIANVEELIGQRKMAALGTMGNAGYNVKRLAQGRTPAEPSSGGNGLGVRSAHASSSQPEITHAHLEKMSNEELKKFLGQ